MTSVTHPGGASISSVYDAAGRIVRTMDPLGNVTHSTYDANGRLTKIIDALGNTTEERGQVYASCIKGKPNLWRRYKKEREGIGVTH